MERHRQRKARPPLDAEGLERLALRYAERYATTRAKLRTYLDRKIAERGWGGEQAPEVEALVARFDGLGYVNDKAFAVMKAASLGRRGFGERRVADALRSAGIVADDGAEARESARQAAWATALRFAERRKIGPFAPAPMDIESRRKAFAAMIRAGHPMDIVKTIISAAPGDVPDMDTISL